MNVHDLEYSESYESLQMNKLDGPICDVVFFVFWGDGSVKRAYFLTVVLHVAGWVKGMIDADCFFLVVNIGH